VQVFRGICSVGKITIIFVVNPLCAEQVPWLEFDRLPPLREHSRGLLRVGSAICNRDKRIAACRGKC
jgi:predicted ATP-grasp superfamily ATP-dependent carboligase